MKIIIADSFVKKYRNEIFLIDLNKLSKKINENNIIFLKHPYIKLKVII